MTSPYESPPRRGGSPNRTESSRHLDPFDDIATSSPTSTFDFDAIEKINQRNEIVRKLQEDNDKLAREALRSKARSFAHQARLLREESEATEEVLVREECLQEACERAIQMKVAISKLQEQGEIRQLKLEIRILNLKVWEYLLKDPDCKVIYAKKVEPRTRPFGKFSHLASSVEDWIRIRQKLEWIEKVLVTAEAETGDLDDREVKQILKRKADAVHRFNRLNDIKFVKEI